MQRHIVITVAGVALGLAAWSGGVVAQQAPAGRGAAAPAQAAAPEVRPALLYKEEWKQPPYTGELNDDNRRVTQDAVTNPRLEVKIYGTDAKQIGVYNHEGRFDLWNGMSTSSSAILIKDKANFVNLTGLARMRAIVRTNSLHSIHPIVKLPDGTMIAGTRRIDTGGEYLSTEVSFTGLKWFKVDPVKVVTTVEVKNPDLSRVDEVGFVDLSPGGGHGSAGWFNLSAFELYAKPVPRAAGTSSAR